MSTDEPALFMPDDEDTGDVRVLDHPTVVLARTETGVYRVPPVRMLPEPEWQMEEAIDEVRARRERDREQDEVLRESAELAAFYETPRPIEPETECIRDLAYNPTTFPRSKRPSPFLVHSASIVVRSVHLPLGERETSQHLRTVEDETADADERVGSVTAPRTTCTKNAYRTKVDARTVINRRHSRGSKRLRTYQCPHCGYWHLTSQTHQRR